MAQRVESRCVSVPAAGRYAAATPKLPGETMSTVHSQPGGGDGIGRLLRSVRRYKGLIVAAVLVGALLGYGWAARQPTLYEGVSRMLMNRCPITAPCDPPGSRAQQLLTSQLILEPAVTLSGNRISVETLRQRLEVEVAQDTDVAQDTEVVTVRVVDSTATGAAQLANAVPAAYEQLLAQQSRRMVAQLEERLGQLEETLAEIDSQLARNPNNPRLRADRAAVARQLSASQEEIRAAASRQSLLRERAAVPKHPISPSPGRPMVIGMLVGLLAAAVLAWWHTRRQGPTSQSSTPEQGPELPSPA
jgi:capsular polysaccharide biosynthesis protein